MIRIIKLIIQATLVGYLVIFSVSNINTVTFKPLLNLVQYEIPLFLLVIIVLFIGVLIGAFAMYIEKYVTAYNVKQLKKELTAAKKEIERLQKITISPEDAKNNKQESETVIPNAISSKEETEPKVEDDIKNALR